MVNQHLTTYWSNQLNISEEEVLGRIDMGDIEGFLEEAMFDSKWLLQLENYFNNTFIHNKELKWKWEGAIKKAQERWK